MSAFRSLSAFDLEALFSASSLSDLPLSFGSAFATLLPVGSPGDAFQALAGEHWVFSVTLLVLGGGMLCFAGYRLYESFRKPLVFLALCLGMSLLLQLHAIPIRVTVAANENADAAFSSDKGWAFFNVYGNVVARYHALDLVKAIGIGCISAALSRFAVGFERGGVAMISGTCGTIIGALLSLLMHICAIRVRVLFCGLVETDRTCSSPRNAYDSLHENLIVGIGGIFGMALTVPRALLYYKSLGRTFSSTIGAMMMVCGMLILLWQTGVSIGVVAQMCEAAGEGLEGSSSGGRLEFWSKPHLLAGLSTASTIAVPVLAFWGFLHQTRVAESERWIRARNRLNEMRGDEEDIDEAYTIGNQLDGRYTRFDSFDQSRSWRRRSRTPVRR